MCYCTKVIYRAVTEKQTLASIKTAHHYGGLSSAKSLARLWLVTLGTATVCCKLFQKSSPSTDQAALSTTSISDHA